MRDAQCNETMHLKTWPRLCLEYSEIFETTIFVLPLVIT